MELAHAALHLLQTRIREPASTPGCLVRSMTKMGDSVADQSRAHHGHIGPNHEQLEDVFGAMHTAGRRHARLDAAMKNADPCQRQP